MRALWATTIALCLLVVGGRPVEAGVHQRDSARIDVAVHPALASVVRRTNAVDSHVRPLYVVPAAPFASDAPRQAAVVVDAGPSTGIRDFFVLLTRSSRGPPRS